MQTPRMSWLILMLLSLPCAAENPTHFLKADDIHWKVNEFAITRWKTLVGGHEGGQIDQADIQFGLWELAPHAIYQGHKHAAPEVYYLLEGTVRWTVDDHRQDLGPGSTIYTPPHSVHRMENLGDTPARAVWLWWAPDGKREVFNAPYEFTERAPQQHPDAKFERGKVEQIYQ